MLLTLKARYFAQLLAVVVLVGASPADAQNSAVLAEDQGIAVAITNFTRYTLQRNIDEAVDGFAGPGFPLTILPAQHTGTDVFLKGGTGAYITTQYVLEKTNGGSVPDGSLGFMLTFEGDTSWDFEAAASDVMHDVKEKVSSDAKTNIKNAAEETGEDAVKAAGAEDGMTEVIDTMKVIKEIAQVLGALDPSFVMKFGWETANVDGTEGVFYDGESCIRENTDSPAAANVAILGPDQTPTYENADQFYVLSAFGTSRYNPGLVDASITPMCAYVCAAFNATNEALDDYSQTDCTSMIAADTVQQDAYNGYSVLNACLVAGGLDGPDGVAWVTPPTSASLRWGPTSGTYEPDGTAVASCAQTTFRYPDVTDSICGTCPVVKADTVTDAPTIDSITAGNSVLVITVTPGADNGAAITDYTATCTDGTTQYTGTSATTTITVGGLTNGVAYTCTVTSTNALGPSLPSAVSSPVTPVTVPDAPTIDSIAAGNSVLVITVTPGADNGAAITDYTATCQPMDLTDYTGTSDTTTITVGGLTNGVAYTCSVIATNALGSSDISAYQRATPNSGPDAPTIDSMTENSNGGVVITVTPGADNGAAITDYTATCTDDSTDYTGTSATTNITVGGLTNGVRYNCTVTSTNALGTSPPSRSEFWLGEPT